MFVCLYIYLNFKYFFFFLSFKKKNKKKKKKKKKKKIVKNLNLLFLMYMKYILQKNPNFFVIIVKRKYILKLNENIQKHFGYYL